MFTFCPLQGALSESTASQSLLELDGGVKVLIDVGWDESFSVETLRELEKQVPTLSLILLTHATVPHIAAYAHCCKNFPLFTRVPVYATRPVIDLGRTLTQALYASTPLAATTIPAASLAEVSYSYSQAPSPESNFLLQAPTAEEIARYFSLIQPLKYSQPHQPLPSPFSPPLNGLTITAYNSGHSLGGTIWHIQHGLESIVYAVDWNQARENVFSGAAWLGGAREGGGGGAEVMEQLRKPTALVCSSRTPEATLARTRRDEQLLESMRLCIARGGTVLIPVDSSARILELAYLLEHAWRAEAARGSSGDGGDSFSACGLYLAGRNVGSTMKLARSMLEWMDDGIVREFEAVADGSKRGGAHGNNAGDGGRGRDSAAGPLDFKYLRLLERRAQVERVVRGDAAEDGSGSDPRGKVILASDASLGWGFSREILRTVASDARNLVILTEKPSLSSSSESIARTLWAWWKERRDGVAAEQTSSGDTFEQVYGGGRELEVAAHRRVPLAGDELAVYQQWLATQRQLQATQQGGGGAAALESSADAVDGASDESSSSESDDESETEQQGKALNISTTMGQASRKKVVLKDEDLGITILLKKRGVYDFDVRGKRGRERMFPLAIRRRRNDEFGELIRPEDYLKAEEREEADGHDGGSGSGSATTARGDHQQGDGLGKKRRWEDFGGKGGTAPNKRPQLGRPHPQGPENGAALVAADREGRDELDELEDEEEEAALLGPCKLAVLRETVQVNLRIAMVDFSGLHDKRSLNMLIPLIQPRKLVLVGGSRDETLALAADCKKALGAQLGDHSSPEDSGVFTPAVGVTVDASVNTNAWAVRLADPLVSRLKWQKVRGLGVVTVTGLLVNSRSPGRADDENGDGDGTSHKRLKMGASSSPSPSLSAETAVTDVASRKAPNGLVEAATTMPTLDVLPTNLVSAVRSAAQPLHVGDLRLADLRRAMQGSGHTAEFRGEGLLLVDGTVVVRKTATGRIEIESAGLPMAGGGFPVRGGGGGGTFYEVKKKIYEGLAVVAGA